MASSYSFANTFKSYFTHTLYQEERNYIYSFLPSILLDHVTLIRFSTKVPMFVQKIAIFMASQIVLEIQLQVDRKQNRSCDSVTNDQLTIRQIDNNFFAHMKELPFLHTWPIDKFLAHTAIFLHSWPIDHFLHTWPIDHVHMFTIDDQKILCNSSLEASPPGDILDQ